MDNHSIELAQLLSAQYSKELSPDFQAIRSRLIGELSMTGLKFDQIKTDAEQAHANARMVTDFTSGLAQPELTDRVYGGRRRAKLALFTTEDLFEARALRETVLWVQTGVQTGSTVMSSQNVLEPYWVVGAKSDSESRKKGSLLLSPAIKYEGKNDEVLILPVRLDQYEQAVEARSRNVIDTISEYDIKTLFNSEKQRIELDRSTPNIFIVEPKYTGRKPQGPNVRALVYYPSEKLDQLKCKAGLSDADLRAFGVFDHLNALALRFNKIPYLQEVLQNRGSVKEESIADTLVNEPLSDQTELAE